MPPIYTVRQKQHALYLLEKVESLPLVSQMLGIPERTLRDWEHARSYGKLVASRDPEASYRGKTGSITVAEIRDRLLDQIEKLTRTMSDDPRKAYFAALAIDRFLNQITSLSYVIDIPVPAEDEAPPPAAITMTDSS